MSRVGREISYLKRSRVVQASNGRKRTRRKGCGYREEAARKKEKGVFNMSRVGREISYLKRSRVVQASNGRKRTRRKGCGYREEAARKKEKGEKK